MTSEPGGRAQAHSKIRRKICGTLWQGFWGGQQAMETPARPLTTRVSLLWPSRKVRPALEQPKQEAVRRRRHPSATSPSSSSPHSRQNDTSSTSSRSLRCCSVFVSMVLFESK